MTARLAILSALFVLAFGAADAVAQRGNVRASMEPFKAQYPKCASHITAYVEAAENGNVMSNSANSRFVQRRDAMSACINTYGPSGPSGPGPSGPSYSAAPAVSPSSFPAPDTPAGALGSLLANIFAPPPMPSFNAAPAPRQVPDRWRRAEIERQEADLLRRAQQRRVDALRERLNDLPSGAPSYAESAVSSSRNSYLEGLEREKLRLEVKLARLRLEALKGARADHSARSEPWHVETAFPVSSREAEQPWAEDDSLARAGAAVTDSLADVGAAVTGAFTDEGFSVSDAWDSWREATTPESMEGYAHKQLMGALPFAAAAGLAAGAITASPVVATVAAGMGAVAVGNGLKNIVDEGMARIKEGLRQ